MNNQDPLAALVPLAKAFCPELAPLFQLGEMLSSGGMPMPSQSQMMNSDISIGISMEQRFKDGRVSRLQCRIDDFMP